MKKLIALLLTFVMLIALCACGSTAAPANDPGLTENTTSAESVVWKISCVDAEGSDYMKAFTAMWERIEKETNGYIDVELYYSSSLGEEAELLEGMQIGTIHGAQMATSVIAN